MKIAVRAGHNVYNNGTFDPGAVGNGKREADITKSAVKHVIPLLRAQGHQVKDVTPYNQRFGYRKEHHRKMCQAADNWGADILLDFHINSGGGTGVECWTYSSSSKSTPKAREIVKHLSKDLQMKNRGVKHNSGYWTLRLGRTPAIIIENGFIDNKYDAAKLNGKTYAEAVAKAFGKVKEEIDITEKELRRIIKDEVSKALTNPDKPKHWADKSLKSLQNKGVEIHERRLDDPITRGELFSILDRILDK